MRKEKRAGIIFLNPTEQKAGSHRIEPLLPLLDFSQIFLPPGGDGLPLLLQDLPLLQHPLLKVPEVPWYALSPFATRSLNIPNKRNFLANPACPECYAWIFFCTCLLFVSLRASPQLSCETPPPSPLPSSPPWKTIEMMASTITNMMAPASNHWPHLQLVPQSLIFDDSKRVLVRDCRLGLVDCSQRAQLSAPWGGVHYDFELHGKTYRVSQNKGTNRKKSLTNWVLLDQIFPSKWHGSAWSCF